MENRRFFSDGRLTSESAHQLLRPHYPLITECIGAGLGAWEHLQHVVPEVCVPLLPRTRAGIIHDVIEERARQVFSGLGPNILVFSSNGFLVVDFFGKIVMRFKKLSSNLQPCNIPTNQQRAFADQTLFAPSATLVTTGYRLNAAGMFQDAHVVCWAGTERLWSLCLPEVDGMAKPEQVVVLPSPPKPVVVAKKKALKKAH